MNYIPLAAGALLAVSPVFATQKTTFVHLFEWRWSDITSECENYLWSQISLNRSQTKGRCHGSLSVGCQW